MRAVASSYRALSLADEIDSARSVLTAAGVATTIEVDDGELSPRSRTAVAKVLREGVTNLLRHSKAEHCEIVVAGSPRLVRMDIVNDGIPSVERKSSDGNGIGNLTTRVRALGGDLHAGLTPEQTYRLRAEIPLPVTASR